MRALKYLILFKC